MTESDRDRGTNIGPVFDEAVASAEARALPRGKDPEYDLIRDNLDVAHYLLQAPLLVEHGNVDPVRNFIRTGVAKGRSPHINFSMEAYLARYPEHASEDAKTVYTNWLRHGRAAGEVGDPAPGVEPMAPVLDMSVRELVDHLASVRIDLQERLRHGRLGAMFAKAAEIEPLIGGGWGKTTRPKVLPFGRDIVVKQIAAMYACQRAAGFERARLLLIVNRPRWGGGRRIEGHLAHAIADCLTPQDVVVIYTDDDGQTPPGRFPDGVREIDLAGAVAEAGLEPEEAERVLVELIRSFHADAVVSINSKLLFQSLRTYGRALHATERIFLALFCNDQKALGHWDGYPLRAFYRYLDLLAGVVTDSRYLYDWLVDMYQLPDSDTSKLQVLRAPVDPSLPVAPAPAPDPARRPTVFWAGRWDRQKRIDLVLEVARRMPDVDFRLWGEGVTSTGGRSAGVPPNVRLEGRYGHIAELRLSEADVWLYTSAWDGVPSQLLEVAMTEVPVVGSLVGGTSEILDPAESFPVAADGVPQAYVDAIREVLADPAEARRRSKALRARLVEERTAAAYAQHAADLLLRKDGPR